jgi:hypothetical protein
MIFVLFLVYLTTLYQLHVLSNEFCGDCEGDKTELIQLPCPDRLWVPTQPPIQWITGVPSPQVKRPGREADHSPPASVEDKNAWRCSSTPQ